jgi:hypothetical protein
MGDPSSSLYASEFKRVLVPLPQVLFSASPPCCSSCTFTAGNAQVYHWQPLQVHVVSPFVNEASFTLLSLYCPQHPLKSFKQLTIHIYYVRDNIRQ